MEGQKLTKRVVDALETKATDYVVWCSKLPGFGCRIWPSGNLVRETKSSLDTNLWRPDERRKVISGRNHFNALGVEFQVVKSTDELPSGGV